MKKHTGKLLALVLAAAAGFSVTVISACAKDNKTLKSNEKIAITVSQTEAPAAAFVAASDISAATLEQAKEIALNHAGAEGASAVLTKEKLDKGVYELKFRDPYGKYEYKIAAVNGAILDFQWDIEALRTAIPLELAKEIVISHAGVDGGTAIFTKEKLDDAVYELKFRDENGKYEYEISAADGTILDYKRDVQAPAASIPGGQEYAPDWEGVVSREQACQTALDAAEVNVEALKYLVCYVSWANHVPAAYEVKFATRRMSYHYTIDLDTGAVLENVCQPHD